MSEEGGVWRTIGGRRVFIKDGEDLATAMKNSGKFKNKEKQEKSTELTDDEKNAVTFWKEGLDGWGYAALKAAAYNQLDNYQLIKELKDKGNDEKAKYLKENYLKYYKDFKSALEKANSVDKNVELYRYVNTFNVPKEGEEVKLYKLDSFTMKPNEKMTEQFGGNDKIVYKISGGKNFKDISKLGNAFTQEDEVIHIDEDSYVVKSVEKKDFYGANQYIVELKRRKNGNNK